MRTRAVAAPASTSERVNVVRDVVAVRDPGERAIVLMCSGNLSITQGVKTMLGRAIKDSQFDPDVVDAFLAIQDEFKAIALRFADARD